MLSVSLSLSLSLFLAAPLTSGQDLDVPAIPGTTGGLRIEPELAIGYTYRYVTKREVRARLPEVGLRNLSIEQQARLEVTERDGGKAGAVVRGRTEHLRVEMRSPVNALKYDSFEAEDRKSDFGRHLQAGLLERVRVVLNREGRPIAETIEGGSFREATASRYPRYGPDEIIDLVELLLQARSDGPVRPGQSWEFRGRREVEGAGEIEFDLLFRRAGGVEHEGTPCERIIVSGTVSGFLPAAREAEDTIWPGMRFEEASLRGEMRYDPVLKGYRHLRQSISLLMETDGGDDPAAESTVVLEQSTTSRLLHRIPTQ